MALQELLDFLGDEKAKLFKATEYIDTYYHQIAVSLESLRDNLIPYSFSARSGWKDDVDKRASQIKVPEIRPQNISGDPEFNSSTLVTLINNLLAVQNTLLANPDITVDQVAVRLGVAPATLYRYLPGGRGAIHALGE